MADINVVIAGLQKVSGYFKSMLKVGYDGDADIYTEHRETVKKALALLKEQEEKLAMMRMIYGTDAKVVGEIVRCKDCKHWQRNTEVRNFGYCYLSSKVRSEEWFCADGKQKEG